MTVNRALGVDNHKYKTTVEYAADLPVHKYGSGFPRHHSKKTDNLKYNYVNSPWNLNNFHKSPQSLLGITSELNQSVSGITIPWVYMGMMFSTFCWHVEDLWLNSVNYSHCGGVKTWYIIPKSDK